MRDAHKSIWIITSQVYKAIKDRHEDAFYQKLTEEFENDWKFESGHSCAMDVHINAVLC